MVAQFFAASIYCIVGNGDNVLFWTDKWLQGKSIEQMAPWVYRAVSKRVKATRTVREALEGDRWIQEITGSRSVPLLIRFLQLSDQLQELQTDSSEHDKVIWRWTASGQFSTASAYRSMFLGQYHILGAKELTRTRAPPRAKFFMWLALLGRCWTNDRRRRHRLQNDGSCSFCSQAPKTTDHLLVSCPFSREIWFKILRMLADSS